MSERMNGRIRVANLMVEGVQGEELLPTVALSTFGLSYAETARQLREVAVLQAVAPVFRVAVLAEKPVFGVARSYGWPVEHLPAPDHAERVLGAVDQQRYLSGRIQLLGSHYYQLHLAEPRAGEKLVATVARILDLESFLTAVDSLEESSEQDSLGVVRTNWVDVANDLREAGSATFEGAEGQVALKTGSSNLGTVLLTPAGVPLEHHVPSDVSLVTAEFTADASLAFEAHVYASFANLLGVDLLVVLPLRKEALLADDALRWVDLGVFMSSENLIVCDAYMENYRELAGGDRLDWQAARAYAAARRLSRSLLTRWPSQA